MGDSYAGVLDRVCTRLKTLHERQSKRKREIVQLVQHDEFSLAAPLLPATFRHTRHLGDFSDLSLPTLDTDSAESKEHPPKLRRCDDNTASGVTPTSDLEGQGGVENLKDGDGASAALTDERESDPRDPPEGNPSDVHMESSNTGASVGSLGTDTKSSSEHRELNVESLLSIESHTERERRELTTRVLALLKAPSVIEKSITAKFHADESGTANFYEYCPKFTAKRCIAASEIGKQCDNLHFREIIRRCTDKSLGDCTFLTGCMRGPACKFIHYEVDPADKVRLDRLDRSKNLTSKSKRKKLGSGEVTSAKGATPVKDRAAEEAARERTLSGGIDAIETSYETTDKRVCPPQWIQCDVRKLKLEVLGKFSVIMADPPWRIHMDLPYGTMEDDEMMNLPFGELSESDSYIFLWITHRAMELGRKCMEKWGFKIVQELLWVKTNQLQKIINTGRTGHWLNHSKEHCLVGVKGNPARPSRVLDCDVLVAELRETSQKPDEIYGLIERLSPGTRKLELFGRPHNVQPNWTTLGNQLDGIRLVEPDVIARFQECYPGDHQATIREICFTKKAEPKDKSSEADTKKH